MPPSASWAPMCCCSKNTRKKQFEFSDRGDITIRINGKEQLTVHNVALRGSSAPAIPRLQGFETTTTAFTTTAPCSSRSGDPSSLNDFTTARTSRELQMRHVSMSELMREVREEAGLPVTSRDEQATTKRSNNEQPLSVNELLLDERRRQMRRAVFNEEGDISSRTIPSKQDIPAVRRDSVLTIAIEDTIQVPPPTQQPSAVRKYVSAAPQVIIAVFAVSYAWLTSFLSAMFR